MLRLYFYVEGQAEQGFVTRVLTKHLAGCGVMVMGAIRAAHSRSHGVRHRGGAANYLPMRNDLIDRLSEHDHRNVRFTSLFDLYGLHAGFPGADEPAGQHFDPYQRVRHLELRFAADIGDHRFIPHIQPHEFESLLLSRPGEFAYLYDNPAAGITALADAVEKAGGPELVNDSYHTCPSRRVKMAFPRYGKVTDGPELAASIGLAAIRAACPHFDGWVKVLEGLRA